MAALVKPIIMGEAMTAWAILIAVEVYTRFNCPNGSERQRKMVTHNPTTTGVNPY